MTDVTTQNTTPEPPKPEVEADPVVDNCDADLVDDALWDIYAPDGLDVEPDGYPRDHGFHREPVGEEGERICMPDRW